MSLSAEVENRNEVNGQVLWDLARCINFSPAEKLHLDIRAPVVHKTSGHQKSSLGNLRVLSRYEEARKLIPDLRVVRGTLSCI